ncbi:hypothetical protein K1719_002299 [Acacia pycnantha]|nr:hypothetical protein K1719_002299 [Acacia pycnantha]
MLHQHYMLCIHPHLVMRVTRRHFATRYTAKITSTSSTGRSLAAEVTVPPPLPIDNRGYILPRYDLICKAAKILLRQHPQSTCTTLSFDDPFSDLSEYLQSLSLTLTPLEASEILKALKTPSLALKFFQFCSSLYPNFRHESFTYNRLLLILSKSTSPHRFDQARSIIDDMLQHGICGSISTINILIGFFGTGEDLERCLGLVKKWDLRLNAYTYKCLLQAYLRSYDSGKALDVYMDMQRRGYKLDIFAYNMLLDALVKDEKVDQAYKIFEDMKRKHCEPDMFTYTIMIRMTGKIGKTNESIALFQEMLNMGCTLHLIAYNTMIQALAKGRMVDKAIQLFSKMVENDCQPNEFTYSVLLNVLIAEGQLSKLDIILKFSNKYMNKKIYAYLVRTLCALGHLSEAHRLFCNMWSFFNEGDKDACMAMLESLCLSVFTALGKLKQISHIHDLFEKMKQDGPLPDIFTYNILIASFGRSGRVDDAIKIFEELEASSFKPDVISYNCLINCLGKNGDLDEAHMRFKEMLEKGLNPDVVTYSTLIECFGKTDKVAMACSLFDEMLAKGCSPNIVTYNILLDCLERCGRTAEAVELYAKLKQQGLSPDSITYAVLERLQSGGHRKFGVRRQNPITGWVVSPL